MTTTTSITKTPTRTPEELEVRLDDERRLTIRIWENQAGRRLVAVKPEHRDRGGHWHLSQSGLLLAPAAARALAPCLEQMAATIECPTNESGEA